MLKRQSTTTAGAIGRGETLLYGAIFLLLFPPMFVVTLAAQIGPGRASGAKVTSLIHEAAADARSAISIALMDA